MTMDFDTVIDEFEARRANAGAESTAERYARDISNQWLPWIRNETDATVWTVERGHVAQYLRHLGRQDYADGTIALRLASISVFYQELYKMATEPGYDLPEPVMERVDEAESKENFSPTEGIDRSDFGIAGEVSNKKHTGRGSNEVPYLTPDEVQNLEEHAPSPKLRNTLIIRLLFTTGARRKELVKLRIGDVDRENQVVNLPAVKSESGRVVPYPPGVEDLLREWLDYSARSAERGASSSEYLFPAASDRGHLARNSVGRMIKKAGDNAGIQEKVGEYSDGRDMHKVSTHALRHSYGVQALKSGMDVRTLCDLMGHSDLEVTKRYLDLAENETIERGRMFDTGY